MGVRYCMMGAYSGAPYQEWRQSFSTLIKEIEILKRENNYWKHTDYKW